MDLSIYIGKRVIPKPAKWAVGRFAASLPLIHEGKMEWKWLGRL
jgi:hypothetical protein